MVAVIGRVSSRYALRSTFSSTRPLPASGLAAIPDNAQFESQGSDSSHAHHSLSIRATPTLWFSSLLVSRFLFTRIASRTKMSQRKRVSPSDVHVHSALTLCTGYFSPRIHARMYSHVSRMTAAALVKKEPDPGEVVHLLARKWF